MIEAYIETQLKTTKIKQKQFINMELILILQMGVKL